MQVGGLMSDKFKYYVENDGDCNYEIYKAMLRNTPFDDLKTHRYCVGKIKKNQVEEL